MEYVLANLKSLKSKKNSSVGPNLDGISFR